MKRFVIILLSLIAISSCKSDKNLPVQSFPYVSAPAMIQDETQAVDYLVRHFWDKFLDTEREFNQDTLYIGGISRDDFRTAFAQYANLLDITYAASGRNAQDSLMLKMIRFMDCHKTSKLYDEMMALQKGYFFDPNSPYRCEDYYLPVLETVLSSSYSDEAEKRDGEYFLPLLKLNCIGTKASDFNYTLKSGKVGHLYEISSEYTILLFSNPGCNECKNIIEAFKASDIIQSLIDSNIVTVLNIYPDEDLTYWYDYMPNYPKDWINGYDQDQVLNLNTIYSLRAIPSLYLLDNEKRVIYKDCPIEKILDFFEE